MTIIAHASCDEHKGIKNGQAGDQTKKEVCIRSWYNKPWNAVIRFKDAGKREKIAQLMEKAAANDKIGYDQNQRNTLNHAKIVLFLRAKNVVDSDCQLLHDERLCPVRSDA